MKRAVWMVASLLCLLPAQARAEIQQMRQTVFGMTWDGCVRAVSAAIEKLEGVESVKVSLKERAAEIKLKPGNKLTVEKVREAVRLSGYEAKDTHMVLTGKLVERDSKPAVEITGTEVVYPLTQAKDGPEIKADAIGKRVTIKGRLPEAPASKPDEGLSLEVVSFTLE